MGVDAYTTHYQDIWGYGHANERTDRKLDGQQQRSTLLTATYAWKISEAWDFDALLGNEIVQDNNKYCNMVAYNFPDGTHINNTVTKMKKNRAANVQ